MQTFLGCQSARSQTRCCGQPTASQIPATSMSPTPASSAWAKGLPGHRMQVRGRPICASLSSRGQRHGPLDEASMCSSIYACLPEMVIVPPDLVGTEVR